jgi:hypothetical protein
MYGGHALFKDGAENGGGLIGVEEGAVAIHILAK